MKSSYKIMTRYITRSKYTDDSSVKNISDTFKKYGITSNEKYSEKMKKIVDVYFTNRLVAFIEKFYDYREFLSYNSHVYVIKLNVSKHMYDLENMRINGKRLYGVSPSTICTQIPLVVLLSNDDTIIHIPTSIIYDNYNDYYNCISNNNCLYRCNCECESKLEFDRRASIYSICGYDVGSVLFYCDYMFDAVNNVIHDDTKTEFHNGKSYYVDIKIPSGLIDFISADRPSLEHYAIDHRKFNIYKLPKFTEYIETNINSIVSENSPPELVKIFNELTSHEEFEPKYKSPTQIKKELARKRIQELEQELNKLKNDIND